MKRRLNFTDRKKILREHVRIELNSQNGTSKSFTVKFDLAAYSLPPDAKVYVHAYHKTEELIYDFGTVGATCVPHDTSLKGLSRTENLKFRMLVVDETGEHGLILAHADRISPFAEGEKMSILPVDFRDIGHQVWIVEYIADEGGPVLVLNSAIPSIETLAKSNPMFFFYVYPAVIRDILTNMVFVYGLDSTEDPSSDWQRNWLQFTRHVLSSEEPPSILNCKDEDFESDEAQKWINRVVEEFCSGRKEWKDFQATLVGGETT